MQEAKGENEVKECSLFVLRVFFVVLAVLYLRHS